MKGIDLKESMPKGLAKSIPDANRLYSILLDAKTATSSETLYDIAEKIVQTEKENAKSALERLWTLKKNLVGLEDTRTIDALIQYYQRKIDILRGREENIGKIGRDSRTLLEEKRKRDAEIATVKQEIEDCSREIAHLNEKLSKATTKEQELLLIEMQLKKELSNNENNIINGLYEIIMHPHSGIEIAEENSAATAVSSDSAAAETTETGGQQGSLSDVSIQKTFKEEDGETDLPSTIGTAEEPVETTPEEYRVLYRQVESGDPDIFPKSVVKTTGGAVIGEYFYDPKVSKDRRDYIFNSLFFGEQLLVRLKSLQKDFNQNMYFEAIQMVSDACRRIEENPKLHFEISTNEIINKKNLKELLIQLKARNYREGCRLCSRLHAKIKALGANYRQMLKEQMARYRKT